jgi:signal transduction histidine kinase
VTAVSRPGKGTRVRVVLPSQANPHRI